MLNSPLDRRGFLKSVAASFAIAGVPALASARQTKPADAMPFKISCTEYSFHRALAAGELAHVDYAPFIRKNYGLDAVEYWSGPMADTVEDEAVLKETRQKADDAGVKGLVILVDREGNLGDPDDAKRAQAAKNHVKWLEAATKLGCHSIRVNAHSEGSFEEQQKLAADGLRQLCEIAEPYGHNVIVENHGGYSSNGKWLAGVMEMVGMDNCGTFPDFGNFYDYDRYEGTKDLMPWAKAVSAKSRAFDDAGNEETIDYVKMMKIVVDAGYDGYVGIEYEGRGLDEAEGVKRTLALLERVRGEM